MRLCTNARLYAQVYFRRGQTIANPLNDSSISEGPGDEISDFEQDESDFELSDDSDSVDTDG